MRVFSLSIQTACKFVAEFRSDFLNLYTKIVMKHGCDLVITENPKMFELKLETE